MKPRDVWIGCAAVLAVFVYGNCRESVGAKRAIQQQQDVRDNITIARMAAESFQQESTFRRQRDSTARVITSLRSRVIPRDSIVVHDTVQVLAQFELRDSVIAALDARHAQDSLQVLFWKGQAVAYRDSLVPALIRARENWKHAASPGILTQVVRAVPYVLAGAVLWEAVR